MPRLNRLASVGRLLRILMRARQISADAKRLVSRLREANQDIADRDRTIAELRLDLQLQQGETEILKSQLAMFESWRSREQERLEAEAAIEASRKAVALGTNPVQNNARV